MHKNFLTLLIQQNVARRHTPTAALNHLLDELAFFTYIRRTNRDLTNKLESSAYPEILNYLSQFVNSNGKLPRIIPICFIQEPVLTQGIPSGFDGKTKLYAGSKPRACIVTLKNVDITLQEKISNRDTACALLSSKDCRLAIASFYTDISLNEVLLPVQDLLNICPTIYASGDSNAHSTTWGNEYGNNRGYMWEDFLALEQLSILNNSDEPTFKNHLGSSCIDLSISNDCRKFSNWLNTGLFNESDHAIILCTSTYNNAFVDKKVRNLEKSDWSIFTSSLKPLSEEDICNTSQLNTRATDFTNNIIEAFNKACPLKPAFPSRPCKWWTKSLSNLIRKKNIASKLARRHFGTLRGHRAQLAKKGLARLFQNKMRESKKEHWQKFISSVNAPRTIAALFKQFKHASLPEMPLLSSGDYIAKNKAENLELLRRTHFKKSTPIYVTNPGTTDHVNANLPSELENFFTLDLLEAAIENLPTGKSPGPDGIKNEVLSRLPLQYKQELLLLFKRSLAYGFIPKLWLEMETIFIQKAGKETYSCPKSYRPIGLSSTLLKLCERLINWRLKSTILGNGIPKQHAFTLGKSTESAISELVNFLEKAKCNGLKAMVISIDIEGAFDSVPFEVIRDSLREHGAEDSLITWIDYLSRNRSNFAKLGNSKIIFRPLEGTTQGGLNGPDIWIICIWGIILTAAAKTSHLSKFADDLISALMGRDLKVIRDILQGCLDELNQWFMQRGLKISAKKSYCLIIDPSRTKTTVQPLTLGGESIPIVKEFRYLGVTIDSGLTWKPHIFNRIKKAKKDLMAARKMISTDWGLSPDKMAWIYESIVRPALDYSCQVWTPPGPFPGWLKKALDKLQRLALLCITSCIKTTPTKALERLTNITPLEHHLRFKASTIVARIYNSIDKNNWDGIGTSNKRGHLFSWTKILGDLKPITNSATYNFFFSKVSFVSKFDPENLQVYSDGSKINNRVGLGWVLITRRKSNRSKL